jgi:hypothetical protein
VDKVNRKSAPRRTVVRIDREGSWGRVEYAHVLDCGHTERRKRASKTAVLACSWCVIAEKQDEQMRALAVAPRTDAGADDDLLDALGGSLAASEKEIAKLKGDIAARLGVSVDYVDVVVEDEDGVLSISFAMVLIPAGDIPAFLARSDSPAS